jgi:translation elongation factor P/translation initiation factor 5A
MMTTNEKVKVKVEYTDRARFQDIELAMGRDIVRGILECITNVDDQYGRINLPKGKKGKAQIIVDRTTGSRSIQVRDMAGGLTRDGFFERLLKAGNFTEGRKDGKITRGLFGRGVRDCIAFGPVIFESIKDGKYTKLTLDRDSEEQELSKTTNATEDQRNRLSLKGNNSGLVVTIQPESRISIPQADNLYSILSNHFALRDLNSSDTREITLIETASGKQKSNKPIRYQYPEFEHILEENINVPGYPDATVRLIIKRNSEPDDRPKSNVQRVAGLLLKSGSTIHENTLFKYEGNPHAGWFSGEIVCEYIDDLQTEYEDRLLTKEAFRNNNPTSIIKRTRDGLEKSHPFYIALSAEVEARLKPLIDIEEEKAKSASRLDAPKLDKKLSTLGKELGREYKKLMDDIDQDTDLQHKGVDVGKLPDFFIAPPQVVLYMGETKVVSAVAKRTLEDDEVEIVKVDTEGVIDYGHKTSRPFKAHRYNPELKAARFELKAIQPDQATIITFKCGNKTEEMWIETEEAQYDYELPQSLQFEKQTYTLSVNKKTSRIQIQAPLELVDQYGAEVKITSDNNNIVVMGGANMSLEFDEDLAYCVGHVEIDPRQIGAKGTLTASLAGEATALCRINVKEQGSGSDLDIQLHPHTDQGKFPARWFPAGRIEIYGLHHGLKPFLNDDSNEDPNDAPKAARIVMAHIVADTLAHQSVEMKNKSDSRNLEFQDVSYDLTEYKDKFIRTCMKIMVPDR